MSGKWTPGPWTAKWSKYEEDNFIVQAGMPSNRVLAHFDGDGSGPDAQSLADAHLIAAAPDLYAALEAAVEYENRDAFYEERPVAPWFDAAANALLKARGEA